MSADDVKDEVGDAVGDSVEDTVDSLIPPVAIYAAGAFFGLILIGQIVLMVTAIMTTNYLRKIASK